MNRCVRDETVHRFDISLESNRLKFELRFCEGSNSDRDVSEICDGENF